MPYLPLLTDANRTALRWRIWPWVLVFAAVVGCGKPPAPAKPVDVDLHVRLVKPELRTIARTIGQPGFIYAYEQTAIYPKVAGYVKKWNADIGDSIKKDQELATLFVPELDAELLQKKAQVHLDERRFWSPNAWSR